MNKTNIKLIMTFIMLLMHSTGYAEIINIRAPVSINQLQDDTNSILVLCHLRSGKNFSTGFKRIDPITARTIKSVDVPVDVYQKLNEYDSVDCQLKMCPSTDSNSDCRRPSNSGNNQREPFRRYDSNAANTLFVQENINTLVISRLPSNNSPAKRTTSVGVEIGTGDIPNNTSTSLGSASTVSAGIGTQGSTQTTSSGSETHSQPITTDVGQVTGTGTGNDIKITLTKAGNATGRILATRNTNSFDVFCLADCATAQSENLPLNSLVTLTAFAEDVYNWTIGDDHSVFMGWSGDPECSENTNGAEAQVTLSKSVNCIATFTLVPPEQINITVTKKFEGQVTAKGLINIIRSDTFGGAGDGLSAEEKFILLCPDGCTGKISNSFPANASISLSVSNDRFHNFDGWTGDSNCPSSGSDRYQTITPNQDLNCTVNFSLKPVTGYTLNLSKLGVGKGSIYVTISRSEVSDCHGDCLTANIYNPVYGGYDTVYHEINGYTNVSYVGRFILLNCGSNCSGGVVNSNSGDVVNGSLTGDKHALTSGMTVSISASADEGSEFAGFTGDCFNSDVTSNKTQLIMSKDSYCAVRFNKINNSDNSQLQAILPNIEPVNKFEQEKNTPEFNPQTPEFNPDFQLNQ